MAESRQKQVREIFEQVLRKDPGERQAFLDETCGDDVELREEVESLLRHDHELSTEFMTPHEEAERREATVRSGEPSRPDPLIGQTIGDFRIRSRLGSGGMGVVYLAEQTRPIRRTVALKIIKLGMDTAQVIARFEAERQALAMMEHPGVAQVIDAGATESGRPYFVMEYVAGVPITDYCDREQLTTTERLKLIIKVCEAVQHAHQKGIIHRDIKPSNVLIAMRDDEPIPKVIDFGVAKATRHHLSDETLLTEQGQIVGTPEYMSPEQAEMSGLDVDTRTDIYSLGVLLYELLTGSLPFDPTELRRAALDEIRRRIREDDPQKPSTRLSSMGEASGKVAARHRTDTRTLTREIRGDLDWITMKAIAKSRRRRYASAHDLAADLQRHLKNEPVVAGPPSATYRMRKFVRRNRPLVAGALAVMVVLLGGVAVSTALAIRARTAERLAEQNLETAEREAEKANAVIELLEDMLTSAEPAEEGRDVLVVEMLEQAALNLGSSVTDEPEVEAAVRTAIGRTFYSLGRFDEAQEQLEEAVDIRGRVLGEHHLDVADSLFYLAASHRNRGTLEVAEADYRRCLDILARNNQSDSTLAAATTHELAVTVQRLNRFDEAEALMRSALSLAERVKGTDDPLLGHTRIQLGQLLRLRGDLEGAEEQLRAALSIYLAAYKPHHVRVALLKHELAQLLCESGRVSEAEPLARDVLEVYQASYGSDSPAVASGLSSLARILRKQGEFDDAETCLRQALAIYEANYPDSHAYTATTMLTLAAVLDDKGESERAVTLFPDAISDLTAAYHPEHWEVANARSLYGVCLTRLERYEEAEAELLRAHALLTKAGVGTRQHLTAERLASLYAAWGKEELAGRWRDAAAENESGSGGER